ncbi:type IV secretory system conjugative DNA transfer family protein [Azohydromonas lata]|uniref:Type IV secretory system conjugative DNA transfer family protein n=1 Tax=Azohydromonas lata TaxID=45677 RepID=A0ABU5IK96_9BURK|nr:type IV secretory system conjugative DNA transfer family protein [Azohydromonas lata]MDZ5459307.1 type IV secretory system conjugative DNA transfer family protein [Azohydromonas lata]
MTSTSMNNAVGPQIRQQQKRSRSGKLVPALACGSMVAGLVAATQQFAHTFEYHASLGLNVGHVYLPWSILGWAWKWHDHYPNELLNAGSVGTLVAATGMGVTLMTQMIRRNSPVANQYMHGSARWAEETDIKAAGLLPRTQDTWLEKLKKLPPPAAMACYVGGWIDKQGVLRYLRHTGPEHILFYAPTRSGKGVGPVLMTLLSNLMSMIVSDLKAELHAATAGWRKHFAKQRVLKFEPAALDSVHWNPLDEVRLGTEYEVGDVQNIALLLVDPDGTGMVTHWQKTSFALLQGLILHALYKHRNGHGPRASLALIDQMVSDPTRATGNLWPEMTTYKHDGEQVHPVVGSAARDQIDRHEEEAGSVLSSMKSYLMLYRDPIVARNVGDSHFRIKDLMHHEDAITLYLTTQPNDKDRIKPLMRLFLTMAIRLLCDKIAFEGGRPAPKYKHKLLMLLDEFPSYGKLPGFEDALSWMAGYGIKAFIVVQDTQQLRHPTQGYGDHETITSNCHVQGAFPPNRVETAEYLSRCTGQTTVVKEAVTVSGKRTAFMQGQVSRTMQEIGRPLLTADEAMRMPAPVKDADDRILEPGDMVVYVAGRPAIYGRQILYFKDEVFLARASVPAPTHSDLLVAA